MGTVGINFGSASSGQGFDVASTVTQILANEQQIESPWKSQLSALQAQDSAFTTLGNDLSTLTTKMQALTDFNGVMSQKQGSSSNTNVLALTGASQTAAAGSHTITVTSLAQTSSNYSDAITNASDVLSGSLTIQVGSGTSNTVTVNSSSNTLASLATAINSAGIGVSGTDGAAGQLTISSALSDTATSTAIGFATGQTGANGSLNVDGIVLSTASNTVTNAIPGVTFQLLAAAPGTPVQVQITNDNAAVESAVNDFVNAYNTVANDIKTQEGKDASGKAQPLYGNPTLSLIQGQLSNAILGGSASGSISSVTQMGITLNNDGTLTLDGNALATALNNNFANVTGFLQNANSFGQNFASILNGLGTQAPSGDVYLSQQQNQAEELALNQSISAEDARIAAQKTTLTTELNSANQILQSIPAQLNQVNEMYSAITGYNSRQMG
jgi:flagellar hook-associated protein 2